MRFKAVILAFICAMASAQSYNFSGVYNRTNETRFENRLYTFFNAKLDRLMFQQESIANFQLGATNWDRREFKELVGFDVWKGFGVRYQNDDFRSDTPGKKSVVFNANRFGIGYGREDKLGEATISNDLMFVYADSRANHRSEWNTVVKAGSWDFYHQLWYDQLNGNVSNYYEKAVLGYRFIKHGRLQWQSEWRKVGTRVDMVGLAVVF